MQAGSCTGHSDIRFDGAQSIPGSGREHEALQDGPSEAGLAEREASPLRSPFPEVPHVGLEEAAEKGA